MAVGALLAVLTMLTATCTAAPGDAPAAPACLAPGAAPPPAPLASVAPDDAATLATWVVSAPLVELRVPADPAPVWTNVSVAEPLAEPLELQVMTWTLVDAQNVTVPVARRSVDWGATASAGDSYFFSIPSAPRVHRIVISNGSGVYALSPIRSTVTEEAIVPVLVGAKLTPGASAPATLPTQARDDPGRAPSSGWSAPVEPMAMRRPLGLFRALRDIVEVLLAILKFAGLLLYHRVSPDRALEHPLRTRLHALVLERPGLHVAALAEALDANPKTLTYHLRVLERSRLVRLEPQGRTLRVLPIAAMNAHAPDISRVRERALSLLRERPLSRQALAERLEVTPQAVSYHMNVLQREGRVRVRWLGRSRQYEAA